MQYRDFSGAWTALVTPFSPDTSIDYEAFERLLNHQLSWWIDGVLLLGTTAEAPTLTTEEKRQIVDFAIKKIAGRCKIMVNVGTNCTRESLENVAYYDTISGIDAYLVVNPYYNKPTQTGLFEHFKIIASSTQKPIFVYNIRWRTGVNLETETLIKLLEVCPNILWVKEASGDMAQIKEVIKRTQGRSIVLSGDDWLTADVLREWGHGVISVASNLFPQEVTRMVHFGISSDFENMQKLHDILLPFFDGQFIQTNPLPIKTSLEWSGLLGIAKFRLPLCSMDSDEKQIWSNIYQNICKIKKS